MPQRVESMCKGREQNTAANRGQRGEGRGRRTCEGRICLQIVKWLFKRRETRYLGLRRATVDYYAVRLCLILAHRSLEVMHAPVCGVRLGRGHDGRANPMFARHQRVIFVEDCRREAPRLGSADFNARGCGHRLV